MATQLARALQNFYTRQGNKILFQNGMTLNQLALEMWERLGYQEVDASVLSRVLSGKRLFSPIQQETFCKILKVSHYYEIELKEALISDFIARHGLDLGQHLESYVPSKTLELAEDSVRKIHKVILRGDPELAIDWAGAARAQVDQVLAEVKNQKLKRRLLEVKSRLLYKQARAYNCVVLWDEIWKFVSPLVREQKKVAKELGSKEAQARVFFNLSETFHILGKDNLSLKNCELASKNYKEVDEMLILFRNWAIDCAILGDKESFLKVEKMAEEFIKEGKWEAMHNVAMFKEGQGWARGVLNLPGTIEAFEQGEALCDELDKKGGRPIFIRVMLARTKLNVMPKFAPKERGYLEKSGRRGLQLAIDHGLQRYTIQIEDSLNKLLN